MKVSYSISRRGPDLLTHEIATVLSSKSWFDFKQLFAVVYANLRARKAASGGEEMMRLRSYEKLQQLVFSGTVEKSGKNYRGLAPGLAAFFETAAAVQAAVVARKAAAPSVSAAVAAL